MKTKRLLVIALLLGLPIMAFWVGGLLSESTSIVQDHLSWGRMAQIRMMLLIYHDVNGVFPPIKYRPEPDGPVHSWRVLLVPHTVRDFRERYTEEYDFTQKWDSQNNLEALDFGPGFVYFSMRNEVYNDTTNYLAVGDDEDWPWKRPMRSLLITKGEDRFLLVEDPDSEIHWMEPKH